jgi:hypothetical protein
VSEDGKRKEAGYEREEQHISGDDYLKVNYIEGRLDSLQQRGELYHDNDL